MGEEPGKVREILESFGYGVNEISRRRDSRSIRAFRDRNSFPIIMAGYGSAAIASVLHELILVGGNTFILAGTCGASEHYQPGETFIISRAVISLPGGPGGAGFYLKIKPGQEFRPDIELLEIARVINLEERGIISSDSFYGLGGVIDDAGKLIYAGPALKGDETPPGFKAFRELFSTGEPFLLDMETAYFYALCRTFRGVRGIAVRSVSNHVPFDPEDPIPEEENALKAAVGKAVELIELTS